MCRHSPCPALASAHLDKAGEEVGEAWRPGVRNCHGHKGPHPHGQQHAQNHGKEQAAGAARRVGGLHVVHRAAAALGHVGESLKVSKVPLEAGWEAARMPPAGQKKKNSRWHQPNQKHPVNKVGHKGDTRPLRPGRGGEECGRRWEQGSCRCRCKDRRSGRGGSGDGRCRPPPMLPAAALLFSWTQHARPGEHIARSERTSGGRGWRPSWPAAAAADGKHAHWGVRTTRRTKQSRREWQKPGIGQCRR